MITGFDSNSNAIFAKPVPPSSTLRTAGHEPRVACYHSRFRESFRPMKTILRPLACALALASPLHAATIAGKVSFATKRGQNPVAAETLVRLEPLGARAPKGAPGAFQMVTRGKTLIPH